MRPSDFDIQKLIDYLEGTCKSLHEGITELYPDMEEEDMTGEDKETLDEALFCCETCNWWHEISNQGDDGGNCTDCAEEEDERE